MMETVFCPVCLQNMSNSGRNKRDYHALPVFFYLLDHLEDEETGKGRPLLSHYYENPRLE